MSRDRADDRRQRPEQEPDDPGQSFERNLEESMEENLLDAVASEEEMDAPPEDRAGREDDPTPVDPDCAPATSEDARLGGGEEVAVDAEDVPLSQEEQQLPGREGLPESLGTDLDEAQVDEGPGFSRPVPGPPTGDAPRTRQDR